MNTRTQWLVLAVGLSLVLALGILLYTHMAGGSQPSGTQDLPAEPTVGPGSEIETGESMPNTMSTGDLLESVLSDPLYPSYRLHSSCQYGFEHVAATLPNLRELLSRADAGTELLARYQHMDPTAIDESWTLVQKADYALSFCDIEMLIAQDAILSNLTEAQRRALLEEALRKVQGKQSRADIYGEAGLECSALLLGRILQQEDVPGFKAAIESDAMLRLFLNDGSLSSSKIDDFTILQAREFLPAAAAD